MRDLTRRRLLARAGVAFALASEIAARRSALGAAPPADPAPEGKPRSRTRLILLGTSGGPLPRKNRMMFSNAVIVDGVPYVVDCGDGVGYRLVQADVRLKDLRYVFITHQHSDHTGGYFPLLEEAWLSGMNGPLDVYAPSPMQRMNKAWFDLIRPEMDIRIHDGFPPFEDHVRVHEVREPGLVHRDERVTVTSAVVPHPPVVPAFAFRFDCPDRSIVFSGDTAKSDNVVALAKGADVLVHEVEDMRLVEKMIRAMPGRNLEAGLRHHYDTHTSPEEVGQVAAAAGVKTLVLSHFAPDVDDPEFSEEALAAAVRKNFSGEVVVGRDLMEI